MTEHDIPFFDWWKTGHAGFSALLFDIDGTFIMGRRLLPGADRMIAWPREKNFPFALLTNDGNHSPEEKSSIMNKAGLDVRPEEVVSCGMAVYSYAETNGLIGRKFFVMGDLGSPCYAERAGLLVTRSTKELDSCEGVIVGEGLYDWQHNITAVINAFVKNRRLSMLVPNPDSYWPNGRSGEIGIGAGGKARFMKMILDEMGVNIEPVYFGKPHRAIYEHAFSLLRARFGLPHDTPRERVGMVGDSLKSDILGANLCGFKSMLLLTGITSREQARSAAGDLAPDNVFPSLGSL